MLIFRVRMIIDIGFDFFEYVWVLELNFTDFDFRHRRKHIKHEIIDGLFFMLSIFLMVVGEMLFMIVVHFVDFFIEIKIRLVGIIKLKLDIVKRDRAIVLKHHLKYLTYFLL